jgi:hypothetical protein
MEFTNFYPRPTAFPHMRKRRESFFTYDIDFVASPLRT